jgi:deoxyribodipyrimidine photo-lyase
MTAAVRAMQQPILWIHGEALGPANPALRALPGRPAVFVFDAELLAGRSPTTADPAGPAPQTVSLKRIAFLYECLLELPVTLRRGDVVNEVLAFAERHGADGVVTSAATDPRFAGIAERIAAVLPLQVLDAPPFVSDQGDLAQGSKPLDLGRFSRYWRRAEPLVWQAWEGP